jgi:hypothetical protein
LKSYDEDPGWYNHPPGTVALKATDEELRRDGINLQANAAASSPTSSTNGMAKSQLATESHNPH